ncbi:MAG: alpha/beta fold hydrolase [Aquificota bacterium]|nr:MAG: alpha/beta fold hydrolase [Aquificota bacterium]
MPRSGVRVPPGPLFFIHGWGFSSKVLAQIPGVDLPFHGRSSLTYKGLWSLARDLALMAQPGSVLVGWSMGASLCLMMAYLFPERFRALLLIGATPCFKKSWEEKNIRGFYLRLRREKEVFLKEFRRLALGKDFEDNLELEKALEMLKEFVELDLTPLVPYVKPPVVLLHGVYDPIVPFSSGVALYSMLRKAIFIPFAGGHFPHEGLILKVLKGLQNL